MDTEFLRRNQLLLQEKLGEGGFGQVHKALDVISNQLVAIKPIYDPQSQEIYILSSLHHPNIVSFRKALKTTACSYLVMEYIDAGTLEGYRPKNENEMSDIITQLLQAVNYMHSQAIIHRDLKPSNILRSSAGTIKVADFGLSSVLDSSKQLSRNCGTFYYMAPEQHLRQSYSKAIDMWGLGIIMYMLATGQHPFEKYFPRRQEFISKIQDQKSIKIDIPETLSSLAQDFLRKLLCPDKVDRYNVGQALRHPFITGKNDPIPLTVKDWIQVYSNKQHLIKLIKTAMLYQYLVAKSSKLQPPGSVRTSTTSATVLIPKKQPARVALKTQISEKTSTLIVNCSQNAKKKQTQFRRWIVSTHSNQSMELRLPSLNK